MRPIRLRTFIVDRPVRVTAEHEAAAHAHLQRRFRLDALGDLEDTATLAAALSACGVMARRDDGGTTTVTAFDGGAPLSAFATRALDAVAPYVTPGGHLIGACGDLELVTLRFDNAQLREPRMVEGAPAPRAPDLEALRAVERAVAEAREAASRRAHDLGYFYVGMTLEDERVLFAEAKCRYCYDIAAFRHTRPVPAGQAVERDCTARPAEGEQTIPRDYPFS